MKSGYILIMLVFSLACRAQEEIPELVTDRPDQTESSDVVPHKSLQIETGFVISNDRVAMTERRSVVYNTTLLRYGLFENFELRTGLEYRSEMEKILDTGNTNTVTGLSPLYLGFKTKITEEKGALPEIAFLGGVALPYTEKKEFRALHPSAIMRFAFSHTLSERLSLGYNLGAEWEEDSGPGYFYSVTLGAGLVRRLGIFIEAFGLLSPENPDEHLLDTGLTFLLLPNLQLDVSGGLGISDAANDNYVSAGLSYRIPR